MIRRAARDVRLLRRQLDQLRAENAIFRADAELFPAETGSDRVLGVRRACGKEQLLALFSFSDEPVILNLPGGPYQDLLTGETVDPSAALALPSYGFLWLK